MVPMEVLEGFVGKSAKIHTSDRTSYTGILEGFDAFANIRLSNVQFIEDEEAAPVLISACIINGQRITFIEGPKKE
ncbi:U6 snRNA-associated Sm-like protein LSm2 [Pancytospora epiphaga]|nr:U6 snRNA-associated Sm-like protein LSm2 [Pancytospora epiphaga]